MVATGLKKFAAEAGLKVQNGLAFGVYHGYMMTLQEGGGWKSAAFAARVPVNAARAELQAFLDDKATRKQYRIQKAEFTDNAVVITFVDNPGTLKRMLPFLELFCGMLAERQIPGAECCSECGLEFGTQEAATVELGGVVYPMHEQCAGAVGRQLEQAYEEAASEGSVASGLLGALIGGLLGAVVWAIAYYFGWFVAWIGFLIAIAASKGYDLLHGRQTKAKAVIVLIVTLLAVIVGQYAALVVVVMQEFAADPSLAGMGLTVLDGIIFVLALIVSDAQVMSTFLLDLLLGLIFAALGVWSTVRQLFRTHSKKSRTVNRM